MSSWKDIDNKGIVSYYNLDAIYGYIRENYTNKSQIFPIDLIKLIIFFYQDGINWKYEKNEVKLLKTAKSRHDKLLSHAINISGIIFNFVLYPRYCESNERYDDVGKVKFGLELASIPKKIEYLNIYFELNCLETNNAFKASHIFGEYQDSGSIINFVSRKNLNANKYETLTFQGCLDILCIKYRQNDSLNFDPRFMDLTKMDKSCIIQWRYNKEIIKELMNQYKIKNCFYNAWRIYSDTNFNHNVFGLCLTNCQNVNGTDVTNPNYFLVVIQMYRIPANIKKLDVMIKCRVNGKRYKKRRCVLKCGSEQCFQWHPFKRYKNNDAVFKDVLIKIEIEIVAAFDYNDKEIPSTEWLKYGIL